MKRGLLHTPISFVPTVLLACVAGCGNAGPSRGAAADAITASTLQQLQTLGNSPLAMMSDADRKKFQDTLAGGKLKVRVTDQKCNPIGEDKYRCDVLVDLKDFNKKLSAALPSGMPQSSGADDNQVQAVYIFTKLGGTWRAEEQVAGQGQ